MEFDQLHLESWQRVNHFRSDRELCRKDLLVKNLKRFKRATAKLAADEARKAVAGGAGPPIVHAKPPPPATGDVDGDFWPTT